MHIEMNNYSKWFPMKINGSIVYIRHSLDGDGKWEVQHGNLGDIIQVHDLLPADMNLEEVVSDILLKIQ